MRLAPARLLLAAGLALFAPATSQAQVSVNPGALDLLPAQPARRPPPAHPAPAHPAHPATVRPGGRPATPAPPLAATPTPAPGAAAAAPPGTAANPAASSPPSSPTSANPATAIAKPALPTIPPAIAALPPPAPVPPPRPQPAPLVPVAADAPGAAATLPNGLRVTFGPDRQDLNPATEAALRALARQLKPQDTTTINIYAYAAGSTEDQSAARRLALARALAARAVLINEGIPSTRIYPRALGATGGEAGQDRVDVMAGAPGPPSSIAPPIAAATPAPAAAK